MHQLKANAGRNEPTTPVKSGVSPAASPPITRKSSGVFDGAESLLEDDGQTSNPGSARGDADSSLVDQGSEFGESEDVGRLQGTSAQILDALRGRLNWTLILCGRKLGRSMLGS